MDDDEFRRLSTAVLDAVEHQVETWFQDFDVDVEGARNGSMLTLTFADGPVLINTQPPLHELWIAARGAGYHYRRSDGDRWRDTRTDEELSETLSRLCSELASTPLSVAIP